VKILTPEFDSLTLISLHGTIFRRLEDVSVEFWIRCAECPPYFYFRSTWPTDLESVSRVSPVTMKISTKFEVDMAIRCLVIVFLLLILYVILWPWSVVIHGGPHDQLFTKFEAPTAVCSW